MLFNKIIVLRLIQLKYTVETSSWWKISVLFSFEIGLVKILNLYLEDMYLYYLQFSMM